MPFSNIFVIQSLRSSSRNHFNFELRKFMGTMWLWTPTSNNHENEKEKSAEMSGIGRKTMRALGGDKRAIAFIAESLEEAEMCALSIEAKAREADELADAAQERFDEWPLEDDRRLVYTSTYLERMISKTRSGYDCESDEACTRLEEALERIEVEKKRAIAAELRAEAAEKRARELEFRERARLITLGDAKAAARMILGVGNDEKKSDAALKIMRRFEMADARSAAAAKRVEDAEERLRCAEREIESLQREKSRKSERETGSDSDSEYETDED
jgi:hypothetical protein